MQRKLPSLLAVLSVWLGLAVFGTVPAEAQGSPSPGAPAMPKVGDLAPDFTLNYFDGNDLKPVSLSQYRGKKNVVVAFFVFAFTGG